MARETVTDGQDRSWVHHIAGDGSWETWWLADNKPAWIERSDNWRSAKLSVLRDFHIVKMGRKPGQKNRQRVIVSGPYPNSDVARVALIIYLGT